MKVPSFKTKKIRDDIFTLVDLAPTREMYDAVMKSIDASMDGLVEIRNWIPSSQNVKDSLAAWDREFERFGEREAYYYQAFLEANDRSVVDAPLFKGDYNGFDFKRKPKWPDIETPWRLANELSTIAAAAGKNQAFLDNMKDGFMSAISGFWSTANSLIASQKEKYEKISSEADVESGTGGPRVYGFWPILLAGAGLAALVGGLGAAAGYTAAKEKVPEQYVEATTLEKHIQTAKTVGIGVAVGVVLALLFMLRLRR